MVSLQGLDLQFLCGYYTDRSVIKMRSLLYKRPHPSGKLRYEVLKEAQKKTNAKYYAEHKVALNEYSRLYYQAHKQKKEKKEVRTDGSLLFDD